MEKFRNTLKKRLILAGIYNGLVILFIVSGYIIGSRYGSKELQIAFISGFFVGIQGVMIYYMNKYRTALKKEEKLKELYIAENDERQKFIEAQIGGKGINIILLGISLGVIISIFLDKTVFIVLLCTLFFSLLVKIILKLYYNKKI